MKKIVILSIFAMASSLIAIQANVNDSIKFNKTQKPVSVNFIAGTSFITGFNGGNSFSTYVAPQFNYPLSKRFNIDAGFAIVNTSFNSNYSGINDSQKKSFNTNYTSTFIYAGGKYMLNDRFTLSGHAYTQVNIFDNNNKQEKFSNPNLKGAMLGIDYKITENSSIGIHMNFSNGNSFYNYNPNGMPGQNPFFNN